MSERSLGRRRGYFEIGKLRMYGSTARVRKAWILLLQATKAGRKDNGTMSSVLRREGSNDTQNVPEQGGTMLSPSS
jgi:hypothetical protein